MSNSTEFMAGFTGSKVLSGTSANTGRFQAFIVNDDAVVSACLDGDNNSLMTTLGLSGVTLRSGAFISVAEGVVIKSITLSSGSVIAYSV